jgi:hypothetical protein
VSAVSPDESLTPNCDAALDFLQRRLRSTIIHLAAIAPEGGGFEDKLFTNQRADGSDKPVAERRDEIRGWIESRNRTKNVYFTTGVVRRDFKGTKPTDADIATVRMLKVDLDPLPVPDDWKQPAEAWVEKERALILASLTTDLPEGVPGKPTLVIDSAGGMWGLWLIGQPYENVTPEEGEHLKMCGEHLIERYRAKLGKQRVDGVADLSRLARLPGTVNWQSPKKLTKGRTVRLACVVEDACKDDRRYGPNEFLPLDQRATPKPKAAKRQRVAAPKPSGVTKLDTLDALDVCDECKVVIAQGCDPDDPGQFGGAPSMYGLRRGCEWKDGNRSAAVFYVCCELVRSRVDDDTIRALLLDEGWGISSYIFADKDGKQRRDLEGHAERQIERAREKVGNDVRRPVIYVDPGRHAEIVDEAERALLDTGASIYQRGPELVRPVVLDRSTSDGGVNRARGATVIQAVSVAWLHDAMSRAADWQRRGRDDDDKATDPQEKHARTLLARAGAWSFPVLRGIVTAPTLRADGSILQVPGYDTASGLIFEPGGIEFPPVPERPTREDAVAALAKFDPLFAEFPFVDEAASAVVFSAVLSGLVGRVLPAIPLHGFDAPAAGTGKSLLSETVGAIVLGHKPSAMNQGKEEAEDEKRLATALRAGDPIIWIDNAERPITGDTICSILTQESVLLRILGKSEQVALPCNVLVMATGNNLTIGGDVTRRSVVCRLDAKEERPDQREFGFNPKVVALERRAEFVVAGLTALRAYLVAGRPKPLSPVGSFERWSEWVRETLVWCGYGDPDETRTAVLADDPRKGELVEVLQAWYRAWGDNALTVSEAKQDEALAALLVEVTGRPTWSSKSVGWWLKRNMDRVVAGLVVRRLCDSGAVRWRVEAIDGRPRERGHQAERDEIDEDVLG